jgi:uncharacterized protein (TIGR02246 family)
MRSLGAPAALVGAFAALAAISPIHAASPAAAARSAIEAVLASSAAAWSAGDLDRFMQSYEHAPDTVYISGSQVVHGYDAIRARYAARFGGGDRLAMGALTVDIVDFRMMGPNHAWVLGKFHLHRDAAHGGDAEGPTTLVFARGAAGWRIVADHS